MTMWTTYEQRMPTDVGDLETKVHTWDKYGMLRYACRLGRREGAYTP